MRSLLAQTVSIYRCGGSSGCGASVTDAGMTRLFSGQVIQADRFNSLICRSSSTSGPGLDSLNSWIDWTRKWCYQERQGRIKHWCSPPGKKEGNMAAKPKADTPPLTLVGDFRPVAPSLAAFRQQHPNWLERFELDGPVYRLPTLTKCLALG
jgi:hypothetical protein